MNTSFFRVGHHSISEIDPQKYRRFDICLLFFFIVPQVTLRGTSADFQELIDRVQQLKTFFTDFHWWFDAMLPHLEKLKESADGKADIDWWQKICHRNNNMSGVDLLMGWLADFIPVSAFSMRFLSRKNS
jgi:hypothetical protein